jgi:folate-binding protein YgfZ
MISHEEYLALSERAALVDRNDRGRLRLTGTDRRAYLQGLLTNDIVALAPGTGCYAALLTAQGRMIADMRVLETGDAILMDVAGSVVSRVHAHLTDFIFGEDVAVEGVTSSTLQWGLYGPDAAAVLASTLARETAPGEQAPSAAQLEAMPIFGNVRWRFRDVPLLVVRSDEIGVKGFDLFIESVGAGPLVQALSASGAMRAGADVVEVCRVEAGRPVFGVDMDEDTIPLEAGIENRAISMTKGCYVGQEIIVRVLHRGGGRVARRLVGLKLEASVPAPGTALKSGDREVGRMTSAVHSPRLGAPIALGYVHRDFVDPGTRLTAGEQAAEVVALPFVRERSQQRSLSG